MKYPIFRRLCPVALFLLLASQSAWSAQNVWGSGTFSEIGSTALAFESYLNAPQIYLTPIQMRRGVADVALGQGNSLILQEDGTAWLAGGFSYPNVDATALANAYLPVEVASGVTKIAAGRDHLLLLKEDGTLWGMGRSLNGALGEVTTEVRTTPVQLASEVTEAAAGLGFTLYLKNDGTLWAMGANSAGQLGDGTTTDRTVPFQIDSNVTKVAAGDNHTLYLRNDGTLWAAGQNTVGQLGDGTTIDRTSPVQVDSNVTAVAAFSTVSFYLKTGDVLWGMGYNGNGGLGDGTTVNRSTPVEIASGVMAFAPGGHSMFVKNDGTLWAMGANLRGQLGDGTVSSRSTPVEIDSGVAKVDVGGSHTLFVKTDGSLWAMGENKTGEIGNARAYRIHSPILLDSEGDAVALGNWHSLHLREDGTLWATGLNSVGQLGDGTTTSRNTFVQMASGVASIAASGSHSLFIKTDDTLWATGGNATGVLGDGTNTNRSTPVQVATNVSTVVTAGNHSLFIRTDGTLWAMGDNGSGRLGDGTTTLRNSPVQIDSGVASVSAGGAHSLYVKNDGTLWAMGLNSSGQLGDGTTTSHLTPVQIASNVARASAGTFHSLFLKNDGTLWAMGSNSSGELGDGTTTNRTTPVLVASNVATVSAGNAFTLFIKTDDTLWGMGQNGSGQLGDGTLTNRSTPVQLSEEVTQAVAGYYASLFLQSTGTGTLPDLTGQPESVRLVAAGPAAIFTVSASGSDPVDYQWRRNGTPISGARSASLLLPWTEAPDSADSFDVVVTNAAGSVISSTAYVQMIEATTGTGSNIEARPAVANTGDELADDVPQITLTFANVLAAGTTRITVGSLGTAPPGTHFPGPENFYFDVETTATFSGTITLRFDYSGLILAGDPAGLRLLHHDGVEWVDVTTGNDATNRVLTGEASTLSPFILVFPVSVTLGNLEQLWDGTPRVVTATTQPAGLDVAITYDGSASAPTDPGTYAVMGTIVDGTYTGSVEGTLSVSGLPRFTEHPGAQTLLEGESLTLTSDIISPLATTYQWYRDGVAIEGATSSSLTLDAITPNAAGTYTVVATNDLGSAVSNAAAITVNYSRMAALAVRSLAGAGDNTLIAGMVLNGSVNKRLIFRGVESTVRLADVPDTINDPRLRLFDFGGNLIDENDDWGGDPDLRDAFPTVGLSALADDSRDAALMPEVLPGIYTVHVTGPTGDTGVALMEVYDADLGLFGSKLSALAVRSFSGPGADVLIVGVVVDGTVPRQVVVRAVGPSLGDIVPTRMTDPELRLYSGSNLIGSNDDWGGDPDLATAFATVGLTELPVDSKDSAMLLTLDPGVYTIHAGGVAGSGVVLMELYAVP